MGFLQSHGLARWASRAVTLLSILSAFLSANARALPSVTLGANQLIRKSIDLSFGKLPAGRSLLQIDVGTFVLALIGDSVDPAAICTVLSDGVFEKWQPSPRFVQQLGSATKLSLSQTDSLLKVSPGIGPFSTAVHPAKWSLADPANLPAGTLPRLFFGYNGPNRPVVFAPNWTLRSGSIQGSNFWMFGVAPGTSEKDVASLAMIRLTPGAVLALTYIDSVKALPAGYQWYQATQPIGN